MKTATLPVNDLNQFTPRTDAQVNAILEAHGIDIKAEGMGDGNTFFLPTFNSLKIRKQLKSAGFELTLGRGYDKHIIFKCY